jgi:hypothetical protein
MLCVTTKLGGRCPLWNFCRYRLVPISCGFVACPDFLGTNEGQKVSTDENFKMRKGPVHCTGTRALHGPAFRLMPGRRAVAVEATTALTFRPPHPTGVRIRPQQKAVRILDWR